MTKILYSQTGFGLRAGHQFENPRFYSGVRKGVTHVYVDGDWPQIVADYEAADVTVERIDTLPEIVAPAVTKGPAKVSDDDRARTHIPGDWRDLPWTGKPDAGLTLRGLATILCDEPVLNKAQAIDAVEAELRRRADALTASADKE